MGGVASGSPVSATNTNSAFLEKNADDTTIGVIGLNNSETASGVPITNTQGELNGLNSFVGRSNNAGYNSKPTWTNNDVGLSTDDVKTRADDLTQKFNASAGHKHTGAAGDAPPISTSGGIVEFAQCLNQAISDNQATPVPIFQILTTNVIGFIFMYNIKRGSGNSRTGILYFDYNPDDNTYTYDDTGTEWGDTGVTLQADFNNGVTPTHRVLYESTSTGASGVLNGTLFRIKNV